MNSSCYPFSKLCFRALIGKFLPQGLSGLWERDTCGDQIRSMKLKPVPDLLASWQLFRPSDVLMHLTIPSSLSGLRELNLCGNQLCGMNYTGTWQLLRIECRRSCVLTCLFISRAWPDWSRRAGL